MTTTGTGALRIGVIAGEESGEVLAADLIRAIKKSQGRPVELVGVGGPRLEAEGLTSLYEAGEIGLVGIGAIVKDLPRLIRRIGTTANALAAAKPHVVITVDSPDFTMRVTKKLRALDPSIPVVHYVCPSVWAWRPGRAAAMKPHVDHVLCLLPFEPSELERLGGPPGTFVGHRLAKDTHVLDAAERQASRTRTPPRTLLVLPGSRSHEIRYLLDVFGKTVDLLKARGNDFRVVLPTLARHGDNIRAATGSWTVKPEIVIGDDAKWKAFGEADGALAASGTVTLELALSGVPLISCYRSDRLSGVVARYVLTTWSGALPNLIADALVVPEYYQDFVRPGVLARPMESLLNDTAARQWQLDGFAEVRRRLATDEPSGALAARVVLDEIARRA